MRKAAIVQIIAEFRIDETGGPNAIDVRRGHAFFATLKRCLRITIVTQTGATLRLVRDSRAPIALVIAQIRDAAALQFATVRPVALVE